MRQIESLRREAHCTYRAMRLLLFGGEQKETAMPFPTSKCGRPGEGRFGPGGVVLVDERTRICGERSTTPDRRNSRLGLGAWCPPTKGQGFARREAPRRTGGRDIRVALPVCPGPAPRSSAAGWHQKGAVALNNAAVPFSCTFFEAVLMQFLMKPLETTAFIKK